MAAGKQELALRVKTRASVECAGRFAHLKPRGIEHLLVCNHGG
jgi:hypothetical protein